MSQSPIDLVIEQGFHVVDAAWTVGNVKLVLLVQDLQLISMLFSNVSAVCHHVLNPLPVWHEHFRSDLLLGQPPEIGISILILRKIHLPSHDACFHEKDLLAIFQLLEFGLGGADHRVRFNLGQNGLLVPRDKISDWVVTDNPGIHIYASSLDKDAFGGLRNSKSVCNHM